MDFCGFKTLTGWGCGKKIKFVEVVATEKNNFKVEGFVEVVEKNNFCCRK